MPPQDGRAAQQRCWGCCSSIPGGFGKDQTPGGFAKTLGTLVSRELAKFGE